MRGEEAKTQAQGDADTGRGELSRKRQGSKDASGRDAEMRIAERHVWAVYIAGADDRAGEAL